MVCQLSGVVTIRLCIGAISRGFHYVYLLYSVVVVVCSCAQ